ncbi:hypothetical protein J6590_090957, partial [Homalodisca vitripennis]
MERQPHTSPSNLNGMCIYDKGDCEIEKLIRVRMIKTIVSTHVRSLKQHGFRSGYSTIDAIQDVVLAGQCGGWRTTPTGRAAWSSSRS